MLVLLVDVCFCLYDSLGYNYCIVLWYGIGIFGCIFVFVFYSGCGYWCLFLVIVGWKGFCLLVNFGNERIVW